MCPYDAFGALGRIGCEQELEFSDVASDDNLGRSFGTSNECAVDSLLPAPTKSPVTAAPTTSDRPSVDLELDMNPCPFCSSGLTITASSEVPGADGATCGDLVEAANYLEEDSENCGLVELAEPFCCPTGDAVTPCPFCPDGITLDEDFVIPGAPNRETCGDLVEIAPTSDGNGEICPQVQAAEIICCPSVEEVTTPPTIESLETPTVKPTSKSTPSPTASPELVVTGLFDPSAGATLHGVRHIVTLALLSIFYVLV